MQLSRSNSGKGGPAPAVSILVPVYNVERYLRECLDSLAGQTLRDLEIICIDDGSTDSSPEILSEYAYADERFRIITKPNTGYGDSMNRGLAAARGRWIGICEPDDFCDSRMYERLVRAGDLFGCDIVKANYSAHEDGAGPDERRGVLGPLKHYYRPFDPRTLPRVLFVEPCIWAGIYRRDLIEGANISFTPSPGASYQDASFNHQCWIAAKRALLMREGYYHYRIDNAASSSKSGAKVYAICDEYDHSFDFLRERGDEDLHLFGPYLNAMRHGGYVWNYNRIDDEHRPAFVDRWIADIVEADDQGLLDFSLLSPGYAKILMQVLDGSESFCARYPGDIPYPSMF